MEYDLLIRDGRVVDGSALPSYLADVGVKDGRIFEVANPVSQIGQDSYAKGR